MNNFQKKLKKELRFYSMLLIFFAVGAVSLFLISYNRFWIDQQLRITAEEIESTFNESFSAFAEDLQENSSTVYGASLDVETPLNRIYSHYYSLLAKQKVKADLVLVDTNGEIHFSSDSYWDNLFFLNYLDSVLTNFPLEKESYPAQRIFRDQHRGRYLLFIQPIWNQEAEGFAIYLLNGNETRKLMKQTGTDYLIYDRFQNVFIASSDEFITGALEKIPSGQFGRTFRTEQDIFYSQVKTLSPALELATYQRSNSYEYFLLISLAFAFFIGVILFLFSLYYGKRFSENTARSIELLSEEVMKIKENKQQRIYLNTQDEFESVADEINEMLDDLAQANQTNIELLKTSMTAERKKLEAQFHPHFLYNTLEVIRSSLFFDPQLSNRLILRLTTILRYSINEENSNVLLREDLEYLEEYLEICKARFELFDFFINISAEASQILIPKLFLLPLVENSLKYGMKKRSDLCIYIEGKTQKDEVQIEVKDNGRAITAEDCQRLNEQLQTGKGLKNHHGLSNSKHRLQFLYPDAQFTITREGEWTIVRIIIKGAESCIE